jgi:O-antigen/teichoic acid export membrane protein
MARRRGEVMDLAHAVPAPRSSTRFDTLRRALEVPFVRNAYSLVGSHLASAVLGAVFFFVAARTFSTATMGRNAALISAMLVLSSIAQLNLTNGFNRFVPTAGERTRRLVTVGYGAAVGAALVLSAVFVLGIDVWTPELARFQEHWPYALWFVGGTVLYTVFALQDAVLTGFGEARWVLVENVAYGVAKLLLLPVAAVLIPALGVFAAWTVPLAVAVLLINGLIFRRLVPSRDHPPLEDVDARIVRRYVGFDMVGSMMLNATIGLLPLLALAIVGPSASAYLFMAWTTAYTLYLVSIGMGMSFVTESSRDPARINELARTMVVHAMRLVVPLALLLALAAPLVLAVLGPKYADHATVLLQLLVLSAIPNVVVTAYLSVVRVQRRMKAVIVTIGALSAGVVVLAFVLMPVMGVNGAGVAWLVSQCVVAAVLLLGELRPLWTEGRRRVAT